MSWTMKTLAFVMKCILLEICFKSRILVFLRFYNQMVSHFESDFLSLLVFPARALCFSVCTTPTGGWLKPGASVLLYVILHF